MLSKYWKSALTTALAVGLAASAQATTLDGAVYCDVNQDATIDANDLPLSGVRVHVDSDDGRFELSDVTNIDGHYLVLLPAKTAYGATLASETLPSDAVIVGSDLFSFNVTPENLFFSHNWLIDSSVCRAPFCGDGHLDDGEICDDGNNVDGDGCSAVCTDEGGQGCTPGYWKQPHHYDSWTSPISPDALFSDVFEDAFPGMSLVEVLGQGGGGLKALGRHVVAALLNTASSDVDYGSAPADIIAAFNGVYPGSKSDYTTLKNTLAGLNELGCPLN